MSISDEEIALSEDTEAILFEFLAEKAIKENNFSSSKFLFEENWVLFFLHIRSHNKIRNVLFSK